MHFLIACFFVRTSADNEDGQENQHYDNDTVSGEGANSMQAPPSSGNSIITSNDTVTSSIRVRAQMPPRQTQPGAIRVAGFDPENQNDSTYSVTTTVESGGGNADLEDLISAQLVGDIPQAEIVEEEHCTKRVKIWSGVAVVLLVSVAVVFGTVLPPQIKANSNKTTDPPTPSPQEVIQELESLLIPVSFDNGTALRTASSPQNKALIWLSDNADINSYLNATKIQRYALATLFYSTNGANWSEKDEWMSNEDECLWYNSGSSVCTRGSVETLSLWDNNLVGTIPNELALISNLGKCSVVLVACCNDCRHVFLLYSHACLSFFILQLTCISVTIV
jgi:hypothetical protein